MKLTLHNLKKALQKLELQHSSQPRSDVMPVDQLWVFMGEDEKDQAWILNLRLFDQEIPEEIITKENKDFKMSFLNFFMTYPFEVRESCFGEIARAILLVNKMLPVPGFCLSEYDKKVYFHYTYPCINGEFDQEMLLTMIALIMDTMSNNSATFQPIARGVKTLEELLDEANTVAERLAEEQVQG